MRSARAVPRRLLLSQPSHMKGLQSGEQRSQLIRQRRETSELATTFASLNITETGLSRKSREKPHTSQDCYSTTPPDCDDKFPLTPPATAERSRLAVDASGATAAIRLLEPYRNPRSVVDPAPWVLIPTKKSEYSVVEHYVKTSFKRFDYDPIRGVLALRMPSRVHEILADGLAEEYKAILNKIIEDGGDGSDFASNVLSGGSSAIHLEEGLPESEYIRCEPDAQFQLRGVWKPGVVIEISYSQDGKNLRKLAQDYILYSNGDIKAVIGVDINYRGKESTVRLWVPQYTWPDGEDVPDLGLREVLSYEVRRAAHFQERMRG